MTELFTTIPWICLLIVFGGMLGLCWKLAGGQHDLSTLLAQALAGQPHPALVPAVVQVPHPALVAAPVVPQPKPVTGDPPWYSWAMHEIGFHETGANQGLDRYIALAKTGANGDPWCAIFCCAALESSGVPSTRSPSSQSFRTDSNFVQLSQPALGCIVVYWRISKSSGQGHVGFYRGEDANSVWTLGGNENDMVQIEALPKNSATFGLIGYWWPKSVALPTGGPVMMPAGSPVHVQTPPANSVPAPAHTANAVQSGITATVFGGPQSAYGGPINDNSPGVALPFRFPGTRPRIRLTRAGQSVDCDIVDIGPWNGITVAGSDPYWITGSRPQAESGTDLTGRHTNKAGIDLTLAAAKAIGVDGKAIIDWQFIDDPQTPTPVVT